MSLHKIPSTRQYSILTDPKPTGIPLASENGRYPPFHCHQKSGIFELLKPWNLGSNSLRYPEMPWFEKYQNIPTQSPRIASRSFSSSVLRCCHSSAAEGVAAPVILAKPSGLRRDGSRAPQLVPMEWWNKNCETCWFTLQSSGQTSMDWLPKLCPSVQKLREFPWPRLDDGIRRVQVTTQI